MSLTLFVDLKVPYCFSVGEESTRVYDVDALGVALLRGTTCNIVRKVPRVALRAFT